MIVFLADLLLSTEFLHAEATPHVVSEAEFSTVLKLYKGLKTLDVSFKQKKNLKRIGISVDSTGTLHVERNPSRVVWTVLQPSRLEVVLTDNEISISIDPKSPVTRYSLKGTNAQLRGEEQSLRALTAWLALDAKALSQHYVIYSKARQSYRFEPKEPSSPFKNLEMKLAPDGSVEILQLEERSGDSIQIHFGRPSITRVNQKQR